MTCWSRSPTNLFGIGVEKTNGTTMRNKKKLNEKLAIMRLVKWVVGNKCDDNPTVAAAGE